MKNNLPDFCVSSKADGFDEFLKVYSEYFRYDYEGFNLFYGVKNNDANVDEEEWTTNIITPLQAIALLNGGEEPMQEARKYESKIIQSLFDEIDSDSTQQESIKDTDVDPQIMHEILTDFGCPQVLPYDENVTMQYSDLMNAMQEYSNQQTAHLQQQLDTLTSEIKRLQEKYDENGYDSPPTIQLQRIEQHVDSALKYWVQQLDEAKEKIEKLQRITNPRSLYDENGNCRICGKGGWKCDSDSHK